MATDDEQRRRDEQADQFGQALKDSARQVWLAGVGAFARAQQEGSKLFEALAKEGASLQDRFEPPTRAQFAQARSSVAGAAAKASERVGQLFDDRVAKALDRLDVPLAGDLDALAARVEALEQAIAALGVAPPPRRRRARPGDSQPPAPPAAPDRE